MFTHYKDQEGKTYSLEDAQFVPHVEQISASNGSSTILSKLEAAKILLGKSLVEITREEMLEITTPPPLTETQEDERADILRALAYKEKADPLFYKYQRGEATKEEWLQTIEAIKAQFPKHA